MCRYPRVSATNVAVSGRATEREPKSVGAVFDIRKGIETRRRRKTPRAPERRGGSGNPICHYVASESFEGWGNAMSGRMLRHPTYRVTENSEGRRLRRIAAPPDSLSVLARGQGVVNRCDAVARNAPRPTHRRIRPTGEAIRLGSPCASEVARSRKRPGEQRPGRDVKYRRPAVRLLVRQKPLGARRDRLATAGRGKRREGLTARRVRERRSGGARLRREKPKRVSSMKQGCADVEDETLESVRNAEEGGHSGLGPRGSAS